MNFKSRLVRFSYSLPPFVQRPFRRSADWWRTAKSVPSTWFSLIAVAVSLTSLYTTRQSLETTRKSLELTRNHQRLTVKPVMRVTKAIGIRSVTYALKNEGTGPAFIKTGIASYGDAEMFTWNDVFKKLDINFFLRPLKIGLDNAGQTTVIDFRQGVSPGQKLVFFELIARKDVDRTGLAAVFSDLDMKVCYCSVYDECWSATSNRYPSTDPVPVPSCPNRTGEWVTQEPPPLIH